VWRLQARQRTTTAESGSRQVEWAIELSRPNGSSAGRTLYSSVVPFPASAETGRALTQVAASINADVVVDWLGPERERVLALRR